MEIPANTISLFRYRWNVPVIDCIHAEGAATFNSMVQQLVVSRDALARALRALTESTWVLPRRKPQAGYRLSSRGRKVASPCSRILRLAEAKGIDDLVLRRWTMPIASILHGWSLRFAEIRALLPGITPRALSLALKDMQEAGFITREIVGGFPPTATYRLTSEASIFSAPLRRLK